MGVCSTWTTAGRRPTCRPDGIVAATVLALAVVQLYLQMSRLGRGFEYLVTRVMVDDTFYYLQPALNLWRYGFVTFDGIHPTNGFQMMWFLILCPVAGLLRQPETLVIAALGLCMVANGLTHWVLLKIGQVVGSWSTGLFLSGLWFALNVATNTYWTGMENSLHALVFCLALLSFLKFADSRMAGALPSPVPLAVVLVLNAWCRLDAAVYSIVFFIGAAAVAVLAGRQSDRPAAAALRSFLPATGVAATGAALLFALFRLMGGAWVPVSALVKTTASAPRSIAEYGKEVVLTLGQGFPETGLLMVGEPFATAIALVAVAVVACVSILGWRRSRQAALDAGTGGFRSSLVRRGGSALTSAVLVAGATALLYLAVAGDLRPSTYGAIALVAVLVDVFFLCPQGRSRAFRMAVEVAALGVVVHACVFVGSGLRAPMLSTWYRAPCNIAWVLVFAFVADVACRAWPQRAAALRGSVVVMVGILVAGAMVSFAQGLPASPIYLARYTAAQWISESLEPEAILASWNSGQIGFLSGRRVINLDGLMNSREFFDAHRRPGFDLGDYLTTNRVAYVVDYSLPEDLRESVVPVRVFATRPDWRPVVVYRFVGSR